MENVFSLHNIFTLFMLIALQAVLGFDNLLYISLESKSAPPERQNYVRKLGIGIAIILRVALLFALMHLISYFQDPVISINLKNVVEGSFNIHSLIVLGGGFFIIYTATKEIWHMITFEQNHQEEVKPRSVKVIIAWIVIMNLVFSFDSILSAMALSDVFWVMAAAIIIGGLLMIWLSNKVSEFLQKNRLYEVLGLFILFVVGIMLVTEGGHLAHLYLFQNEIVPMSKTTFYFVILVLVLTDVVQGRYQKVLLKTKK